MNVSQWWAELPAWVQWMLAVLAGVCAALWVWALRPRRRPARRMPEVARHLAERGADEGARYGWNDSARWTPDGGGPAISYPSKGFTREDVARIYDVPLSMLDGPPADVAPDGQGATEKWSPKADAGSVGQSEDMTDEAIDTRRAVEAKVRAEVQHRFDGVDEPTQLLVVWPSDDKIEEARWEAEWQALDRRLDDICRHHRRRLVAHFRALPVLGGDTGAYELVTTIACADRADIEAHERAADTTVEHRIPDAAELAALVEATSGIRLTDWQRQVLAGPPRPRVVKPATGPRARRNRKRIHQGKDPR